MEFLLEVLAGIFGAFLYIFTNRALRHWSRARAQRRLEHAFYEISMGREPEDAGFLYMKNPGWYGYQRRPSMKTETRKIVRTYSAGVFFAEIESRQGKEAVLRNARRLWYWQGASSLSELAQRGTSDPNHCKFPVAVDSITVTEVIEILDVTPQAAVTIDSVKVWTT